MPGNRQKFFFCDETERMKTQKKQLILAVSGIKNSGKTTLITALLPALKKRNLSTAVIKHDGHEFEADIPGTDTWKGRRSRSLWDACFFRYEIHDGQISSGRVNGGTDLFISGGRYYFAGRIQTFGISQNRSDTKGKFFVFCL